MKKNFFLFIFLIGFAGISQTAIDKFNNVQTDIFYGIPIEHDNSLENAIQGNSYGFLVSLNTVNNLNTEFNALYNYPERGYSFIYLNNNSTILGESVGVYRHFTYNLTPKKENGLLLTTGFGVGVTNKKYDRINNNLNFAYGSKLLASAYLKLQYNQILEKNKLSLNAGASLIHFSNVAFNNPNLGLNNISLHLGLNYKLSPINIDSDTIRENNSTKSLINYYLIVRGGYNESLIVDSGLHPFLTISFYGSKKINNYSKLTSGIDFFNSTFIKQYIKDIYLKEGKDYFSRDFKRAGIFFGHELTQNNFAFISQLGYTFYYPVPYVSPVYERFGFKYKLSEHLVSEITMKVNLFRAEALEIGLGYKF